MPSTTATLLDLDDTICRYRRSEAEVLAAAFEDAGVEPFFGVEEFRRWIPRVNAESPLDLRERCFAGIAGERDRDPEVGRRVASAYEPRDPANVEFLPGAEEMVERLADRYALGLVTNGGRDRQTAKLSSLGIADAFDATTFATPESAVKPDPAPFERALSDLDVDPGAAVHVGDSLSSDVAGANAAGVRSVWVQFDRPAPGDGDPTPDHVVPSPTALSEPPEPWADGRNPGR